MMGCGVASTLSVVTVMVNAMITFCLSICASCPGIRSPLVPRFLPLECGKCLAYILPLSCKGKVLARLRQAEPDSQQTNSS
ncbi:hypothetical protein F4824DRAFT_444485 [Ustulina deusta]|nr:hypothetical protein F4824DRAFT_444485 [Ustulina deusta]